MLLSITVFTLLVATLADLHTYEEPAPAVEIQQCVTVKNGVKRPSVSPSSCNDTMSEQDCASMFGLNAQMIQQNKDENKPYMVNGTCYTPVGKALAPQCRSMCALCCIEGLQNQEIGTGQ
ncbi:hypothetical protein Tcan_08186 [Toxocara canis]|uniref:Secreted protein n=1 Tax=Toxocara canis TaxID=6265 RepID=A0A0B2VRJ1_TOXCA|nr:hypothetical protein Tcan_08186 [Toxocara canis]